MIIAIGAIIAGAALLFWSADRFVESAAFMARHFGMPSLLIGMIIVGFGTSIPEMLVSAIASWENTAGIALGNAFGSNIANIGLILGLTAVIHPINVQSRVLRRELPMLTLITGLAIFLITDLQISRINAAALLSVFFLVMFWTIHQSKQSGTDPFGTEIAVKLNTSTMTITRARIWIIAGLVLLVLSSRLLVWGAVSIAASLGISDLVIGLTIVAVGTSLPELAASLAAALKNEHDIALGNIIGSNIFNTLAVAGIAGSIRPLDASPELLFRDMLFMGALTISIFLFGYGRRHTGRINRREGGLLLCTYCVYVYILIRTTV